MAESSQSNEDVIDVLLAQHEQVRSLFDTLRTLTGEAATEPFDQLRELLAVHETAEEEVVYPALRQLRADDIVQARLTEEDEAKKMLADLEKIGPTAAEFAGTLASFEKHVLAHAAAEESEIFPRLRQGIDLDQRRTMAQALRAAEAVAPTHAHKTAPESAIGNLIVGPFVALVDRVRDAIKEHTKKAS